MDSKIINSRWYQCCYTNASHRIGDTLKTGWQEVAVSDDIPQSAHRRCRDCQVANSEILHPMVDEDGNILNLLELMGDGTYLYMIRTQYGLTDANGRTNMFSHAYIFPCEDADGIDDPNTFLTIANENFTSSETQADETKNRELLIRNPGYSIRDALEHCGLSDELYLTLVRCVYAQLCADSITKPLYVEYDGSEEQIRELLYLIYSALPLYARRRFSAVSCPKDNLKGINIVFSKHAKEQKRYLVPQTGENSVLSEAEKRRFFRLEYMEHAVGICRTGDMGEYYKRIEERAIRLGNPSASDPEILRIAYKIYIEQKPASLGKKELTNLLKDVLQINTMDAMGMNFIVRVAREFDSRGYELENKMKAQLIACADNSKDKSLQEIAEKYRVKELENVPSEADENISQSKQEEQNFPIFEKQEDPVVNEAVDKKKRKVKQKKRLPENMEQESDIINGTEPYEKLELDISASENLSEEKAEQEETEKQTEQEKAIESTNEAVEQKKNRRNVKQKKHLSEKNERESNTINDTEPYEKLEPDISDSENLSEEKEEQREIEKETEQEKEIESINEAESEIMLPPEDAIGLESMEESEDITVFDNRIGAEDVMEQLREENGDLKLIINIFSGKQLILNKYVNSLDDFAYFLSQEYIRELSAEIPELESVSYKNISRGYTSIRKQDLIKKIIEKIGIKKDWHKTR